MDTRSMPAAPLLRRTHQKASSRASRLIRPVRECVLTLVKTAPFQQEPMERRIGRITHGRLRGECFLASLWSPGRPDDPAVGPVGESANCSREVSGGEPAHYGVPFRAEALLWGRCHPRASSVGPLLAPLRGPSRFVM